MANRSIALVTGAGRGIGRGIVIELARSGFDIAGVDVVFDPANRKEGLVEVKQQAAKLGAAFLPIQGDIAALDEHRMIVEKTLKEFGRIDLLVNNAGVAPLKRTDMLEMTAESFDRVFSINARGTFFLTQKVAKQMIKQVRKNAASEPAIVFISSISAYVSSPHRAEYCVSKAAMSHTATLFADRLAEYGINVYEIRPGIIKTAMTAVVQKKYDRLIAHGLVPQKRWGLPGDVGRAVAAVAGGCFAYSTGMVIEVSGGMNIRSL